MAPENMHLVMGGFDCESITAYFHVPPHTFIVNIVIIFAPYLKKTSPFGVENP
jgi:hypothetical protein